LYSFVSSVEFVSIRIENSGTKATDFHKDQTFKEEIGVQRSVALGLTNEALAARMPLLVLKVTNCYFGHLSPVSLLPPQSQWKARPGAWHGSILICRTGHNMVLEISYNPGPQTGLRPSTAV
jgi:hypothetical protein